MNQILHEDTNYHMDINLLCLTTRRADIHEGEGKGKQDGHLELPTTKNTGRVRSLDGVRVRDMWRTAAVATAEMRSLEGVCV